MSPLFRRRTREGEPPLPPDAQRAPYLSSPSLSYSDPSAFSEPEPRPTLLGLFVLLFFKPKRFFQHFHSLPSGIAPVLLALSLGLAAALSGGIGRVPGLTSGDADTWTVFWPPVLLFGLIWGMIVYFIGDWWFKNCIRWSGDRAADKANVRKVFLWSGQITALPVIIHALSGTFIYPSPSAWAVATVAYLGPLSLALLALFIWTLIVHYVGVRKVFHVRAGRARFWFVALPLLLMFFFAAPGALMFDRSPYGRLGAPGTQGAPGPASGIRTETPHVDDPNSPDAYRLPRPGSYELTKLAHPRSSAAPDIVTPNSFSSRTMSFSYPGNWKILKQGVTFEPDSSVWVQAPCGSVQGILLYGSALGERAALEFAAESFTQMYQGSIEVQYFDRWGTFAGRGLSFQGKEGDHPVTLRVFAASVSENRVLEIREVLFNKSLQDDRLGHELIRSSLKLLSGSDQAKSLK